MSTPSTKSKSAHRPAFNLDCSVVLRQANFQTLKPARIYKGTTTQPKYDGGPGELCSPYHARGQNFSRHTISKSRAMPRPMLHSIAGAFMIPSMEKLKKLRTRWNWWFVIAVAPKGRMAQSSYRMAPPCTAKNFLLASISTNGAVFKHLGGSPEMSAWGWPIPAEPWLIR